MEIKKVEGILCAVDFSAMSEYNVANNTLKCVVKFSISDDVEMDTSNELALLAKSACNTRTACVIFDFTAMKNVDGNPFTEATATAKLNTLKGQTLPLSIGLVSLADDLGETAEYTANIGGKAAPIYTLQRVEVGHGMAETGLLQWARNTLKRRVAAGTLTKVELPTLKGRREQSLCLFCTKLLFQSNRPLLIYSVSIIPLTREVKYKTFGVYLVKLVNHIYTYVLFLVTVSKKSKDIQLLDKEATCLKFIPLTIQKVSSSHTSKWKGYVLPMQTLHLY